MRNSPQMPYQLDERHFYAVLTLALIVHMLGFVAWHYSPKTIVTDIPIRTLNVRLGDAEDMTEILQIQKPEAPAPAMQAINDALSPAPKPAPSPIKQPSEGAKQYVREVNSSSLKKTDKGGSKGGKDAEIMSRYTQLTSLWVTKFQVYPEEARKLGLQGTVTVRIRVDRRGNIRYYAIEKTSGIPILDSAAIDMVRRSNPVPAMPDDYPGGEVSDFLIPVIFSLS